MAIGDAIVTTSGVTKANFTDVQKKQSFDPNENMILSDTTSEVTLRENYEEKKCEQVIGNLSLSQSDSHLVEILASL